MSQARLVTIGISHFCEKARWALEWTGTPFVEEAHAPGLHVLPTRRAGWRSTPVLLLEGVAYTNSTDILEVLDARARAEGRRGLYPTGAADRSRVQALEHRFDEQLGPAVRRVMYHLILPHRALALALMGRRISSAERRMLALSFPLLRGLMLRSMRIDAAGAARSLEVLERVFDEVATLTDGRGYLVGDHFTASDLSFAALAAPALLAPGYDSEISDPEGLPPEIAALVKRLRATRAGAFALEMYRRHRAC